MDQSLFSSSNVHRREVCIPSLKVESDLPEQPDSEWSTDGSLCHALFAEPLLKMASAWEEPGTLRKIPITDEHREAVSIVERSANKFIAECVSGKEQPIIITERRLAFRMKGKELFTGQPDKIYFYPIALVVVVVDAKFGWDKIKPAVNNAQLASYIAMVSQILRAKIYFGAILNRFGGIDRVVYKAEGLGKATKYLTAIWKKSQEGDAPLNPTPSGCQFCRGFLTGKCPAIAALPREVEEWKAEVEKRNNNFIGLLEALAPEDRTPIVDRLVLLKKWIEAELPKVKERIQIDKKFVPKYSVGKPERIQSVSEVEQAFKMLVANGVVSRDDATAAMSLSLPTIQSAARKRNNWTHDEARDRVRKLLEPFLVETQKAGSLEREK